MRAIVLILIEAVDLPAETLNDSMQRLLIATRNAHKTREIQEILGPDFDAEDLSAYSDVPSPIESGKTFAENAILKAVAASKQFDRGVIADDSGLEVDALRGAPGIFSARYAGEGASDQDNVAKLLRDLARIATLPEERRGRFRCVIALARDGKLLETFEGAVEGYIAALPRGREGFGYDPVFVPNGFHQTFAGLPSETKSRISHRAQSLGKLKCYLRHSADKLGG